MTDNRPDLIRDIISHCNQMGMQFDYVSSQSMPDVCGLLRMNYQLSVLIVELLIEGDEELKKMSEDLGNRL